ncbi:hypothetical protein HID58_017138 [Brassica napus]|uniref:Casein kinase II subunit beta n=1 Tax=Brassica napus TaxID=3708 RepID=A0ABQ8D682_BRANA|nr:hypothetical protein HID58_017138 [Brassica napus]
MHKGRSGITMGGGGSSSRSELLGGATDRKRINEALDKHLKKSLDKDSFPSTSTNKSHLQEGFVFLKTSVNVLSFCYWSNFFFLFLLATVESEGSDVSGSEGEDEDTSWISWFCNLRGNEFFCEVDEDYVQDDFNLCGLSGLVPYYDYALDLILDIESSNGDMFTEEQNELVESAAEMLYGLIHVRYILTSKGMAAMVLLKKCPRVFCSGQSCLPVGQSDIPRSSTVKIYCPKCEDLYYPRSKYEGNIDGAYFGTTFPHLFLMAHGNMKPQKPSQSYVPKIFGFKVHKKQ